jgi:hypothetical protein
LENKLFFGDIMGAYLIIGLIAFLPVLAIAKSIGTERTKSGDKISFDSLSAFYAFIYFFFWILAGVALFLGDGAMCMLFFGLPIITSIVVTSIKSILSKD